jgi:predicted AlkP superfamily pyrophosphatase or phosphodiesterase
VDTVLDWLDLPDGERPDFITLYFDEPDHVGHGSGPNSEQVLWI